jgi:hypothetical protein
LGVADLDPLLSTIMRDPVILPTSRVTIDLATIKSHLLSVPTDPFNRSPLKIEDVIPGTFPFYKTDFRRGVESRNRSVQKGKTRKESKQRIIAYFSNIGVIEYSLVICIHTWISKVTALHFQSTFQSNARCRSRSTSYIKSKYPGSK